MNFLSTIFEKLYQTFVYEQRYLYFLEGLKYTIIIALASAFLGLLLGTIIALIRDYYKENKKIYVLKKIADFYVYIIRGTPTLLQLMILYYVVFRTLNISVVLVGIITFSINSSAYVAEIIRAGLESNSLEGQREASKTLGLKYFTSMKCIIFPQAIKQIFPALGNECITLLKETSIAGYIGIVELIKASDIVSSRTYDYFFPLIISALIYLLLTFILTKLMNYGERKLNHDV